MKRAIGLLLATLAGAGHLSGCSSSSSSGNGGGGNSNWTPGQFLPSGTFAAQCANPRTGNDSSGFPFPDIQGSAASENQWLRSWSNELYLWYDEITDRDPASLPTDEYFRQMRTFATTPSGADKDKFHFTYPTEQWEQLSQSGVSAGYGAEWVALSRLPPRDVVVAFVEPGTPAAAANLARGARLLMVDGFDIVNANDTASIDALNGALFPSQPGETREFTVADLGSGASRTFSMTSATITSDPVQNVSYVDLPAGGGRIGYMLFNDHIATSERELVDAVTLLDSWNIDDLVLDIRYNGGGYLFIASQLAYMIAGPAQTAGRIFESTQFNDKHPATNPVTGQALTPMPFIDEGFGIADPSLAGDPLPTLGLARVYVLTGPSTCSASESVMNGLAGAEVEVVQIGSTTCGKPYGFYPADNCGTTYFSIQFRGVNHLGFGDYTDGFSPANTIGSAGTIMAGCSVADDFGRALGDPAEGRFAAALSYRDFGTCPAATGFSAPGVSKSGAAAAGDGRVIRPPWREIRILDR